MWIRILKMKEAKMKAIIKNRNKLDRLIKKHSLMKLLLFKNILIILCCLGIRSLI